MALAAWALQATPAMADCTSDTECKGERVCVDGRCADPRGDEAPAPRKVKRKFATPALFYSGIVVAALTPIALFVTVYAAGQKGLCEDQAKNDAFAKLTPTVEDAHCSNYNGTIIGGAISAAVLGISGTTMIILGSKRVPVDAPTEDGLKVVPWTSRDAGGVWVRWRF